MLSGLGLSRSDRQELLYLRLCYGMDVRDGMGRGLKPQCSLPPEVKMSWFGRYNARKGRGFVIYLFNFINYHSPSFHLHLSSERFFCAAEDC